MGIMNQKIVGGLLVNNKTIIGENLKRKGCMMKGITYRSIDDSLFIYLDGHRIGTLEFKAREDYMTGMVIVDVESKNTITTSQLPDSKDTRFVFTAEPK